MIVKTRLIVDLLRPGIAVIDGKQWDKLSRQVELSLYAGSEAFIPPTGSTYEVRGIKPDKTLLRYSLDEAGAPAVSLAGNVATVSIVQQALACPGDVKMGLVIKNGSAILSTFSFTLRVEQSEIANVESVNYVAPALATFFPSVSPDGVISWTNDGGLENPEPVDITGPAGAKIVSTVFIGTDAEGGNRYRQTFDDGSTAVFTAPRGPAGAGNVSSVAGQLPDQNGDVPLIVTSGMIEAGAVSTTWTKTLYTNFWQHQEGTDYYFYSAEMLGLLQNDDFSIKAILPTLQQEEDAIGYMEFREHFVGAAATTSDWMLIFFDALPTQNINIFVRRINK